MRYNRRGVGTNLSLLSPWFKFYIIYFIRTKKISFLKFFWNFVSPPFYGRGLPNSDALLMCYNASFNDAVTLMVAWHFTVARFWPRVFSVCNAVHSAHLPMQRWENLYNLFFSYFFYSSLHLIVTFCTKLFLIICCLFNLHVYFYKFDFLKNRGCFFLQN